MVSRNVSSPPLVSTTLSKLSQATPIAVLAFKLIPNVVAFTLSVALVASVVNL